MPDAKSRQPRFHGRVPGARACSAPGCVAAGEFRAPVRGGTRPTADSPGDYQWLCLDHVRAFNASYNFFEGMSAEEITAQQTPYAGWERETRAFAAASGATPRWADFIDPLDAIQARYGAGRQAPRNDGKPLSDADRRALKVLGLEADADRRALRQRYSELVRRYHPDRNGGDRSQERALQAVIEAYGQLKKAPAFA
ncbi:J domain-containing protein [uncultured Sphingomonas sp.]|uniref:J domain-containing protein n=1 Tax=uncultured Sphingomonas sp. TaxID=158754 RepID=UPI0025DAEFB4|nr:J domain-containing protein [uncultured Sphingomonas sp.]